MIEKVQNFNIQIINQVLDICGNLHDQESIIFKIFFYQGVILRMKPHV